MLLNFLAIKTHIKQMGAKERHMKSKTPSQKLLLDIHKLSSLCFLQIGPGMVEVCLLFPGPDATFLFPLGVGHPGHVLLFLLSSKPWVSLIKTLVTHCTMGLAFCTLQNQWELF